MICCPQCDSGASVKGLASFECNTCGLIFHRKDAKWREPRPHRMAKPKRVKPEKYRGAKAGPIIYPGFVYGATRLG